MKKKIISNYYQDRNPERHKEILYCIQKNLDLNFIEKINVFISNDERNMDTEEDLLSLHNNHKLKFIHIPSRLKFSDIVNYCSNNLEPTYIGIFINLDIFLEDSLDWKNIENFFNNSPYYKIKNHQTKSRKMIVSLRHNFLEQEMSKEAIEADKKSWEKGDFADCYVFESNFLKDFANDDLNFYYSCSPGSDCLLLGIFSKYYQIFSLGKKYKIFHYDICQIKKPKPEIKKNLFIKILKLGDYMYKFNHKPDMRVIKRLKEWVIVPPDQDWETYLLTGRSPKVHNLYENKKRLLSKKMYFNLKIIYRIILIRVTQFLS